MSELTFESIAKAGRRVVEAHRGKRGLEEGIRRLLSELYPDNAHFIYELLQNAEDAEATVVEFALEPHVLEVRHNGTRAFSLHDIDSITNIGDSTKSDDPTQIGKFGVGFKAVYSYTSRPEVRSGEFSFAIEDLFVNERVEGRSRAGWTTFRFPFDRDEKPAAVATEEIARGLVELDEKTLLFLRNICTIQYTLHDGTRGRIEREDRDRDNQVIAIQKSGDDGSEESLWLRLVGDATVDHDGPNPLSVAAAFKLEPGEPPKQRRARAKPSVAVTEKTVWSIIGLDQGDVSIYFPAVKEFSGLKFHIHAPFASTVARDSVRDDPGNVQLVTDIGEVIVRALPRLREQGMINDSFLATLPNEDDVVGEKYHVIRDAIFEAFNGLEITPVRGRGFGAARDLVSSPGEFRNWLIVADLQYLLALAGIETEREPRWVRDRDGRAGRFLGSLDTIEFGWAELDQALDRARDVDDPHDPYLPGWFDWLNTKPDSQMSNLYRLLGRGFDSDSLYIDLETVPLVRLARRGKHVHVKGPEVFLPSSRDDRSSARVPVALAFFEDDEELDRARDLKAFYDAAGVRRWDETARIERRLVAYKKGGRPVPDSDDLEKHLNDVRAFTRYALDHRESARAMFGAVPFLLIADPGGNLHWTRPTKTYLDTPFKDTGFSAMYRWDLAQCDDNEDDFFSVAPKRYAVPGIYREVEDVEKFLELVGAQTRVEIVRANVNHNPEMKREWWRNKNRSRYTVEIDWDIADLGTIVEAGDSNLLRTLWQTVLKTTAEKADAVFCANATASEYRFDSRLARRLKSVAWVLTRDGDLKLPREVTYEALPEAWDRPKASSRSLVHKLGFGADAARRRQREEGVNAFLRGEGLAAGGIDVLRAAKQAGMTNEDLLALIREREASSRFPESASDDPARRSAIAASDAFDAPEHRTEIRSRSVVGGQAVASEEAKSYLRGHYTTSDGKMFCQACHLPMPFKVGGQWYFEAVQVVTKRRHVHRANALALCPLCAALYKHARTTSNDELIRSLAELEVAEGQGTAEVAVVLDGRRFEIRFTGKHAIDIQAALSVAGDARQ